MRERSLDQFESIFERASIPVLDIQELDLKRIAAVLRGGELDESVLRLARYLGGRFEADVRLHWSAAVNADQLAGQAEAGEFARASGPFGSTAELVGQISIGRSQLVLLADPHDTSPAVDIDALVQGTAPPILLIRRPLERPQAALQRVLHSLTGNFQQTQNFAHSFALVEDGGAIVLLHTIDQTELHQVRDALRVSPDIGTAGGEELLQSLTRRGERYLKAVVAASREFPYDVSYRLAVGEVRATVEQELAAGDYGLLVVGRHQEGYSHVEAEDYQLMHQVRHVPVLAL
jgi:hypothetical protein